MSDRRCAEARVRTRRGNWRRKLLRNDDVRGNVFTTTRRRRRVEARTEADSPWHASRWRMARPCSPPPTRHNRDLARFFFARKGRGRRSVVDAWWLVVTFMAGGMAGVLVMALMALAADPDR